MERRKTHNFMYQQFLQVLHLIGANLTRIIHTDCRDVFLQVGKRRDWDLDGVIS